MPSLTPWAAFCPCGQCYPRDQNKHTAAPVKVARQQTTREHSGTFAYLRNPATNRPEPSPNLASGTYTNTRRNSPPPEPSKTFCANLRQHTPEPSKIFRSLPELAPRTGPTPFYTGTLRNFPEPKPAYAGTLRNLPEPVSRTYTSIRRNFQEPSGTRLTPELSGTFRNPPPEPTPAYAGTFRNLPEPPCGTYSSTPQNPLEPSGTFLRNLLLRPAPAHTGAYLG